MEPVIAFEEFAAQVAPAAPVLPYAQSASKRPFLLHPRLGESVTVYIPAWYPTWMVAEFAQYADAQWGECPVTYVRVATLDTGAGAALLGFAQVLARCTRSQP